MERPQIIDPILYELHRGHNVLLLGERGMGKSHTLGTIAQQQPQAFYFQYIGSKKAALMSTVEKLFRDGKLDDFAYYTDWQDVAKRVTRLTVVQLKELIAPHIGDYLFVVDNLESVSEKSLNEILLPLLAAGSHLLAAADESTATRKRRVALIRDRCTVFEMPPLTRDDARTLLWELLDRDEYANAAFIETRVLDVARGRPGIIADLAEQIRGTGGDLATIRELSHTVAQASRVNLLLPTAIAIIALLFAARYLVRGLDDPTAVILAGVAYALTVALRPLVYRATNDL